MVVSRIKCTGEANIVPTGGNFPVVCVMQHLKGPCTLFKRMYNQLTETLCFFVPNPKLSWSRIILKKTNPTLLGQAFSLDKFSLLRVDSFLK